MKHGRYRVLSFLLCVALLVTAMPQQAYANIKDTVQNTDEENSALLEQLREIGENSETAEAVIRDLQNMGLLDKDGALVTSTKIMVDGTGMSLAEVKQLIEAPGADLSKKVSVEGEEITLKSLQTMLQIEEELARIEEEYFNGCDVQITDEHKKTYASLLNYLQNNQLVLEEAEEVQINHNARIKVTQEEKPVDGQDCCVVFTFTLVDKNNPDTLLQPEGYEVTAEYSVMDGSAMRGYHYTYDDTTYDGKVTLKKDNGFKQQVVIQKLSVDITDLGTGEDYKWSRWDGTQSFYLQVKNPVNALLLADTPGDRLGEYVLTRQVELTNTYTWAEVPYIEGIGDSGALLNTISLNVIRRDAEGSGYTDGNSMANIRPSSGAITVQGEEFGVSAEQRQAYADGILSGNPRTARTANTFWNFRFKKYLHQNQYYESFGGGCITLTGNEKTEYNSSFTSKEEQMQEQSTNYVYEKEKNGNFDWKEQFTLYCRWDFPPDTSIKFQDGQGTFQERAENIEWIYSPKERVAYEYPYHWADCVDIDQRFDTYLQYLGAPEVESVTAPAGTYPAGSVIPITVTYSQPVRGTRTVKNSEDDTPEKSELTLKLENGTELTPVEQDTTARRFTFLYQVPENAESGSGVHVASVTGGFSAVGEELLEDGAVADGTAVKVFPAEGDSRVVTLEEVSLEAAKLAAFSSVTVDKTSYGPKDTVKAVLNIDQTYSNWLDSDTMTLNGNIYLAKVYVKAGQGTYPLLLDPETEGEAQGSRYIAEFSAQSYAALELTDNRIEIYYDGSYDNATGTFSGGKLVAGMAGSFAVTPVVAISGLTFDTTSYPDANTIYQMAESATVLKVKEFSLSDGTTCTPEELAEKATFPEFKWYSGDTDVAVINREKGIVTVKASRSGQVQFKVVAENNGFKRTEVLTPVFQVEVGGPPNVMFQQGSDTFFADRNKELNLLWTETVTLAEGYENARFVVELFQGNYSTKEELEQAEEAGEALLLKREGEVTWSEDNWSVSGKAEYTIPAGILNQVSQNNVPTYTVRVSTPNPHAPQKTLSAIAHIVVIPQPAKVHFDKLENYYRLDTAGSVNISWTLEEYTGGDFSFSVKKNGEPFDIAKTEEISGTVSAEIRTGNYTLTPDPVPYGTLKDVYTVTVKTKNTTDAAYSTDSFLLHIYDEDAMELWVDGEEPEKKQDGSYQYVMDNNDKIAELYGEGGETGRDNILDLKRNISLKNTLSINYKEYPYGAVTDQIAWDDGSSDTVAEESDSVSKKVASINYPASSYTDITAMEYESFRPSTEFLLAGLADGKTTITATHARTKQQLTLDLSVNTLKDKLYLFQFYPVQETTATYVNGNNEQITVVSNANGELAVYDEYGIASNINLSSGSGEDLYLGTLYQKDLMSQEGNAAYNELYPQNNFKLRRAATLKLYIKDADGKPYTGEMTYRGAVYKNGKLCADTMTGATQEIDGRSYGQEEATTITLNDEGRFEINMDATRFWTEQNGETLDVIDKIDFIYELQFAGDDYYPQLITVNGNINEKDVADFGENIVTVKSCEEQDKYKPFVSTYQVDYSLMSGRLLDVTDYTGKVGVTDKYQDTKLQLLALLWGVGRDDESINGYEMDILREDTNRKLNRQSQKVYSYPFSTMSYVSNDISLTPESTGLDKGEKVGASVCLKNGADYARTAKMPFQLTNMIGVQEVNKSEDVDNELQKLQSSGNMNGMVDLFDGDSFLQVGMSLVSKNNGASLMNNKYCQLKLVATQDPTIYRGIILLNADAIGETNRPMIDFPGEADENVNYKPTALDMLKMVKNGVNSWHSGQMEKYDKAAAGKGVADVGGQVAGYYECEVRYNYNDQKWKLVTTGGGFTVSANIDYAWYSNFWAGPVPVTIELAVGGIIMLDFKSTLPVDSSVIPTGMSRDELNDFLTTLRIWFYIRAFAGIGVDYSVIALKIGIYGQVDVDNYNYFLTRTYAKNADLKSQRTTLHAELGIKFLFKILFISYEKVIASTDGIKIDGASLGDGYTWKTGQYTAMENWMKKTNFPMAIPGYNNTGGAGNTPLATQESQIFAARLATTDMELLTTEGEQGTSGGTGMTQVSSDYSLESRDYLEKYGRFWGDGGMALMSLDEENKLANLEWNTYPYANPVITRDGAWMGYISDSESTDLNDTRACFSKKQNDGSYYIAKDANGICQGAEEFPQAASEIPTHCSICGQTVEDCIVETEEEGTTVRSTFCNGCDCLNAEKNVGADSDLVMDGNSGFAAAAWIRQNYQLPEAESTPASQDLSAMVNGSEIYASVLTNAATGEWTTTRLTNNSTPDLSPVVAAGNGKAIVAWRMTAGSSTYYGEDGVPVVNYDDRSDSICYKIYNAAAVNGENDGWSEIKTLYMGDLGKVKSLSATMMQDGTIAVAYTIDTDINGELESGMGYESVVNIIDGAGNAGDMIRLTSNDALDQGIQVAAVTFPDGKERFVTAWYYGKSEASGSSSDIHFMALSKDGRIETDFVDALSDLSATTGAAVTEKFAFAKGDNLTLDSLTLLWSEPILSYQEENDTEAQADGLKAVKFCYEADADGRISRIYLTSALDVADMEACTAIDHFEAAVVPGGDGATVSAVLLGSLYAGELEQAAGNVYTVEPISQMLTASATFENKIQVEGISYDAENIISKGRMTVAFNIANLGFKPVEKLTIKIGSDKEVFSLEDNTLAKALLPNSKLTQSCVYTLPAVITDADYYITAEFAGGATSTVTGTLNLDVPDLKVATLEMDEWGNGIRTYKALLTNGSDVKICDNANRRVRLGVYSDANCEKESMVAFTVGDTQVFKGNTYEITGDELTQLDNSNLVLKIGYDIRGDLVDGTFPEDGITLYTKVWAEENTAAQGANPKYEFVSEFDENNNQKSIRFSDPVTANNGAEQEITVEQENEDGITKAQITVRNLSMKPCSNGNLVISLQNEKNQVIETQLYAKDAEGLISLEGEESLSYAVSFLQAGYSVKAGYFTADADQWQNKLSVLQIDGTALTQITGTEENNSQIAETQQGFVPDVTEYSGKVINQNSTIVQAAAQSIDATVAIQVLQNSSGVAVWNTVAEAKGAAAGQVTLCETEGQEALNEIRIVVTPKNEQAETMTYTLYIANERQESNVITLQADQSLNNGYTNSKTISISTKTDGITGFVPVKAEYRLNQGQWNVAGIDSIGQFEIELAKDGKYVIDARLTDSDGYHISAGTTEIWIDRTAPVIDEKKVVFTETNQKLEKEETETNLIRRARNAILGFLGIASDGNSKNKVQVEVPVLDGGVEKGANPCISTDEASGIASMSLLAGEKTYPMSLAKNSEGEYVYRGIVADEYRGALIIKAVDLAGNETTYRTEEIVISDSIESNLNMTHEANVDSITIKGSLELSTTEKDLQEYGIRYRKAGATEWTDMEEQKGSRAGKFTFKATELENGCLYEYQLYTRLVTENERNYGSVLNCRTLTPVSISVNNCEKCKAEVDKEAANVGEEVTFTIHSCKEHTPSTLSLNGVSKQLQISDNEGVFRYTVKDADRRLKAETTVAVRSNDKDPEEEPKEEPEEESKEEPEEESKEESQEDTADVPDDSNGATEESSANENSSTVELTKQEESSDKKKGQIKNPVTEQTESTVPESEEEEQSQMPEEEPSENPKLPESQEQKEETTETLSPAEKQGADFRFLYAVVGAVVLAGGGVAGWFVWKKKKSGSN